MAPEMIMDHQHVTEKADVWSLGVVFWEMLTLEVPFADMPPAQLIGGEGLPCRSLCSAVSCIVQAALLLLALHLLLKASASNARHMLLPKGMELTPGRLFPSPP